MQESPYLDLVNDAQVLRSNLNSTELLLSKFKASLIQQFGQLLCKTPQQANMEAIATLITLLGTMQSNFTQFKTSMDLLVGAIEALGDN